MHPHNGAVAKSDKLLAQRQRVENFIKHTDLECGSIYSDQGNIHPVHLLPGLQKMIDAISLEERRIVVLSDHPGRLGHSPEIQAHVMDLIREAGSHFVWADLNIKSRIENLWKSFPQYFGGADD